MFCNCQIWKSFTYSLNQVEMHSSGRAYPLTAEYKCMAASSECMSSPETLGLLANVPNWTLSKHCMHFGALLDARRFAGMFLDGRSKMMVDRRGMRHDTDNGARGRRWSAMRQWYAGTFFLFGPSDMPFFRHGNEVANVRRLDALFWRYREKSAEVERFNWLSLCCFETPYDKFHLVRDSVERWCEHDFERCQRINVKGCKFVGCHNLVMFAISPWERDVSFQAVQDEWNGCKSFCAWSIQTPVVCAYMTDKAQSKTGLERELIQMFAEAEYHVLSLGAILRYVRYGTVDYLSYPRTLSSC